MDETHDVYSFVDEEDQYIASDNQSSAQIKHKQYIRHSLAKDWNRITVGNNCRESKPNKEFKLKLRVPMKNQTTNVLTLSYKQFIGYYRMEVKKYYTFLPIKQINELVRKLWTKLKRRQLQTTYQMNTKSKGVLKKADKKPTNESKKRVSFNLSESQLNTDSEAIKDGYKSEKHSLTKKKTKQMVSRYVKPLNINYESPKRNPNHTNNSCVQLTTHSVDKSPPIEDDSDPLLDISPQLRAPSLRREKPNHFKNQIKEKSTKLMTKNVDNNCMESRDPTPERGRDSDYNFDDFTNSPKMDSFSEELLENSPQFRAQSPKRNPKNGPIERKQTPKANMKSFCSPILNELNSTKGLKKYSYISMISLKNKSNRVLRNKSNEETIHSSRKALFMSPIEEVAKQLSQKSKPMKVSIPIDLVKYNKIILNRSSSQLLTKDYDLTDLFESDVSQNDYEINLSSDPLMK